MKYLTASVAALGLMFAAAAPLHAANVSANNLVTVQLTNVDVANQIAQNLARNVDISVEDIAAQIQALNEIQVPIGVAANVCPDLEANVISPQHGTNDEEELTCTAENTSQAFNQAVKRQLALQ